MAQGTSHALTVVRRGPGDRPRFTEPGRGPGDRPHPHEAARL